MGQSRSGKKAKEKKSNVVTMPTKEVGEDAAAVENSEETAAEKKPRNGKRKTTKKEDRKARKKSGKGDHKGARKALRHAVKKAVKEHKDLIAETLAKKTAGGDKKSADVMLSLMEKKKKNGEDDFYPDGPSLAEQLAAEPSWDEMQEEKRKKSEKARGIVAA